MKEKLRSLVESYFDKKELLKNDDIIMEITGNIYDRYDELITSGVSEKDAFEQCRQSLGNISILSKKRQTEELAAEKPLSLYAVYLFSAAAIILFFVNTLASWSLVLMGIVVFFIEYVRQYRNYYRNPQEIHPFKSMTGQLKPLVFVWMVPISLTIIERLNVLLSDFDKLTIDWFISSEPFGMLFLICLVFYGILMIPVIFTYNIYISRYDEIVENPNRKLRIKFLFPHARHKSTLDGYKKKLFYGMILLTLLNILITLISDVIKYYRGPVLLSGGEEVIRTVVIGRLPLFRQMLDNMQNIGLWIMLSVGLLALFVIITGLFVKQVRSWKIYLSINILWLMSVLLVSFVYMLYTGIIYDMTLIISHSVGVVSFLIAFMIVCSRWKVLFYE